MKTDTTAFPEEARAVTRVVRKAFSEVLASVGADPRAMLSIHQKAGINKNLAWKLSKIVEADDPAVILDQMPGPAGLKIFLQRVENAGAGVRQLDGARDAIREYERLAETHTGGDRDTLEMLSGTLSPAKQKRRDEQHRKMLFQGTSYICGVQARVSLRFSVLGPGSRPDTLDFVSLTGLFDFRRLRPDVSWVMAGRRMVNDDGTAIPQIMDEALDPRHEDPEAPALVEEFCSKPLPQLRPVADRMAGTQAFELVEGPIGNSGLLNCVVGTVSRGLPAYATPGNEWAGSISPSATPCECYFIEQLTHRSFDFARQVEVSLHSPLRNAPTSPPFGPRTRLPMAEQLEDLGLGATDLLIPELPEYQAIVDWVFRRTGWNPADFHVRRLRIEYPVCPANILIRYRLPPAPATGS